MSRGSTRTIAVVGPVLVSLVLLGLIELGLRLGGFQVELSAGGDPKVNQGSLFAAVRGADGSLLVERVGTSITFRRQKPKDGVRVFVVGESSVWGFPYGPDLSFSRFLEDYLEAAWPERLVEVVNAGVPGIGSWHVLRIVEEITRYDPDVLVIYTGHNDWILPPPEDVPRLVRWLARLRLYQLAVVARDRLGRWRHGAIDVSRIRRPRDPWGRARDRARGTATMTAAERHRILERYRANLRAMVAAAQHAGATAIVASLGQNLRDFPPGASRHRPGLSHSERAQWRAAVDEARRLAAADHCEAALRRLDEAAGIDSRPALLHFARAQCLDVLGRTEQARAAYRLASDLDEIPLGAPSAMNEVMRDVAEELHTRFVDVAAAFRSGSEDGIPGDDLFLDHIHPTISGHALVGRALARELTGRPARDGPDPRVLAAAMPDLEKRVFFARLPLYLILRWYDAAAREGAKISRRFPDVHVEQVIERLREEDPAPDPTDVYAAPS